MAQHQASAKTGFLELVPFFVVLLLAAHVLALVYWIFRLATEKQQQFPGRTKKH
ncbi:hypothetical protein BVRB_2g044920 [Beta vulgaris subsp. vulgaris]|uniref:Transmembrane protein n=1 Tax=Beta vulgaris subsp. vulgaris TaxID=3555 RepID=A0A0J8BH26_BETVV|nr:hypothetical protein BVRB_2g044920 [Beta vulgaris subsp. vulgaris]